MNVLAHHTVNDECLTLKNKVPQTITKVRSSNSNHGEIFEIINAIENPVCEFLSNQL